MRIILILATLSLPLSARAAETTRFGARGSFVPSGSVTVSHETISVPSVQGSPERFSFTSAAVRPTIDYFFTDDISLGVGLGGGASAYSGAIGYQLSASLGVGYHLRLGEDAGLYPRVSVEYVYSGTAVDAPSPGAVGAGPNGHSTLVMSASAPLLYHLGHFFIGAGPRLQQTVVARTHVDGAPDVQGAKFFSVGLATVFGGWF